MPKPITVTKDLIDQAAFSLVREAGIESLTARNIADMLGSSTKPIYRVYGNMETLKETTLTTAIQHMQTYVYKYQKTGNPMLDSGLGYISFAKNERELFKIISMNNCLQFSLDAEKNQDLYNLLAAELKEKHFPDQEIREMLVQILVFSYGLAMISYNGLKELSENEAEELLLNFFNRITK